MGVCKIRGYLSGVPIVRIRMIRISWFHIGIHLFRENYRIEHSIFYL